MTEQSTSLSRTRKLLAAVVSVLFLAAALAFIHGSDAAEIQTHKSAYNLLSLLLSGMVFYLVCYLDLRGLKLFLHPKAVSGGVLIVILMLFIPLAIQLTAPAQKDTGSEKQRRNRAPVFSLENALAYPGQYTRYYNRRFPLRASLIHLNNLMGVKLFNVSPIPNLIIGKDNWLFLHKKGNRPSTVDYYRNLDPFTRDELETWKTKLEHRNQWLAKQGIEYLFMVVPNKNTIYPEYMPERFRKAGPVSRLDQLLRYMKKHSAVHVLDIREALRDGKKDYRVYSATDTHWNDWGAYIAHREIIKYISRFPAFQNARPLPLAAFNVNARDRRGGDLAGMLTLQDDVLREDRIQMDFKNGWRFTGGPLKRISRFVKQGYTQNPNASLPKMLMVHDSFYNKLKPFISQLFSRVRYIWDWDMNFYPDIIKKEKPKLVIDEMAERFLLERVP